MKAIRKRRGIAAVVASVGSLTIALLALWMVPNRAEAFTPQWQWCVGAAGGSNCFDSQSAAVAYMRTLNSRTAVMVNKGIVAADVYWVQYRYGSKRVQMVVKSDWGYTAPYIGGSYTSYEAALAAAQADHDASPNNGCAKGVITAVEDWRITGQAYPDVPSSTEKRYHRLIGRQSYVSTPTPRCEPVADINWGDFTRTRNVSCPTPYDKNDAISPHCYFDQTQTIFTRPWMGANSSAGGNGPGTGSGGAGAGGGSGSGSGSGPGPGPGPGPGSDGDGAGNGNSNGSGSGNGNGSDGPGGGGSLGGCVGNPCDVASGDKYEVAVDYIGVGLSLTRHYHSLTEDQSNQLGHGWNHSYQARVIIVSGVPRGLIRPSGAMEALQTVTAGSLYISQMGSGLRVRNVGSEWHVFRNDGSVEVYDSTGRYIRFNDHGWVTTLSYNSEGQLISVVGPFGHTLSFTYDTERNLASVTDPANRTISYSYAMPANLLTGVQYQDGTSRTYHYENTSFPNNLTGITDERGVRYATFGYDSLGRAQSTEHAGGTQKYTLVYASNTTTVTDALGRVSTFSFSGGASHHRRVSQITSGGVTRAVSLAAFSSDFQRRANTMTDERGFVVGYTWDQNHMLTRTEAQGTPLARTVSYQYLSPDSNLVTLMTEPGRTTAYTYNALGKVLTQTVTDTATAQTRTWTYTYNSVGQMLTADGPRSDVSDVTTYSYYTCTAGSQCGRLQTVTDPAGNVTTYNSYDAHGSPLSVTDPNGVITTFAYDFRGRLTSQTTSGEISSVTYWPGGLLKRATFPDGSWVEYTYDNAQRLTEVTDNAGNRLAYTLDLMGNVTAENVYDPSNALRRTQGKVYDSFNRLWKVVGAAGTPAVTTVLGYDGTDNLTAVNAPLGRNSSQTFDSRGRLTQITDPASGITQLGYNANDELTSVNDPKGLVTTYTRNGFGDVTGLSSPDTGTSAYTYNSTGQVATATDARGAVASHSYDASGRLSQIAYGDQTLTFGYDAGTYGKGQLTSASDANHSTTWTYDALGRVTAKGQTVGGVTLAVGYGYSSGRLASFTTPSGQVVSYGYGTDGRLASVAINSTTLLAGILHEPFGGLAGWQWGNGTLAVRTHDTDGRITQIDSGGFKSLGYDDASRITAINDGADPNKSWAYGYDSLDRLASASKTGTSQAWTYDANGNRLTETGTTPTTFAYASSPASNRLVTMTGTLNRTYSYDAAGNVTGYAGATFTYNNRGRMTSASFGGHTATYVYNAAGQRIRRISTVSGTVLYVYDEAGHIVGEYDGTGSLIQETVWIGDIPVATLRPNGSGEVLVYYVHADHLNTPRVVTQPSNNAERWRWESDPFGVAAPNENPQGAGSFVYNLRFPGQIYDGAAGLYQNWHRDYDPALGRYVKSDPIGLDGGLSTFAYSDGNPISMADPNGLDAIGISYRGYPIQTPIGRLPLGHAAVVAVNPQTGGTRYYEYGRYNPGSPGVYGQRLPTDDGNVRRRPVPDVVIGNDGRPTAASLQRLYDYISQNYGKGRPVEATYHADARYQAVIDYANRVANDRNRDAYSIPGNTCYSFRNHAIGAAR